MQHAVIAVVTVREAPDHLVQGHFIPRFHIYAGQVRVSGQVVTVADYDGIVESLHEAIWVISPSNTARTSAPLPEAILTPLLFTIKPFCVACGWTP